MSRGLGKLQREILATLWEAKQEMWSYHGCARLEYPVGHMCNMAGAVIYKGNRVVLENDVFDLFASSRFLLERHGIRWSWRSEAFKAAFSRAVKSLVARGIFQKLALVPVQWFDPQQRSLVYELSDGTFLATTGRKTRFVHGPKSYIIHPDPHAEF